MVLNILRSKKFSRRIFWGILIFIIPAFVLWGVGSLSGRPSMIGMIGTAKIYPEDLSESRQGIGAQLLLTYYGDVNTMNQILRNRAMMNIMAWERLVMLYTAKAENLKVSDNNVRMLIAQHPLFIRQGSFDPEMYDYILRNTLGLGHRQFEELVRQNLQVRALRQEILKDVVVLDEELLAFYKKFNDNVDISYIFVDKERFADKAEVNDEETAAYYKANRASFIDPSKVEVEYMEFAYNDVAEKRTIIEKMEKLYPEITGTPDEFKQIATKNDIRYGETDAFAKEDVVGGVAFFKGFTDTAFMMKDGDISPPLFSAPEKGVAYILHKTGSIAERPLSFEESEELIITTLQNQRKLDAAEKEAFAIYDRIQSISSFDTEATALTREVRTAGPVRADGYIESIGPARDVVLAALEVEPKTIIRPITTKNGVAIVRLDSIVPADEAIFEENKEDIRQNIILQKQAAVMEQWFRENTKDVRLDKPIDEL